MDKPDNPLGKIGEFFSGLTGEEKPAEKPAEEPAPEAPPPEVAVVTEALASAQATDSRSSASNCSAYILSDAFQGIRTSFISLRRLVS